MISPQTDQVLPADLRQAGADERRQLAERILLISDLALGHRCPICHGKPAVRRPHGSDTKEPYRCGADHQWDPAAVHATYDRSPRGLLKAVAETGELPPVPEFATEVGR